MDEMGHSHRGVVRYEHMIVRFYNSLACNPVETIEEIPADKMEILAHVDYKPMIEPMVAQDLRNGLSQRFLAERYGVTRHFVMKIGTKYQIPYKTHQPKH